MISIDSTTNKITMTRSDSLIVTVTPYTSDGEVYEPDEGDYIRFAMSKKYLGQSGYQLCVTKEIPTDTFILELEPEDTSALAYGTYNYDIELTHADGRVDTYISSTITLNKEVK